MNRPIVLRSAQSSLFRLALATLLLALSACSPPEEAEETAAPAPEPLAAPVAELFGSGTISTAAPEFATSLTADGATVYFNRTADDRSTLAILAAQRANGIWNDPETLPFSGVYFDVDPFVTADGSHLLFSSNRPDVGEAEPGDFDLWVVDRDSMGEWSEPRNLGAPVNTEAAEIYSTLSSNGNLYFSSDRDGESFLYVSRWIDGKYGEPERLVLGSESESVGGNPAIAPDESFLIFSGEREAGHGGSDLYVSFHRDGAWTAPRNLGEPVNSAFADFAPVVSWDGAHLFWTSERPGIVPAGGVEGRPPGDLYRVEWAAVAANVR